MLGHLNVHTPQRCECTSARGIHNVQCCARMPTLPHMHALSAKMQGHRFLACYFCICVTVNLYVFVHTLTGIHFSLEYWTIAFQFFVIILSYLAVTRPATFNNKYWWVPSLALDVAWSWPREPWDRGREHQQLKVQEDMHIHKLHFMGRYCHLLFCLCS